MNNAVYLGAMDISSAMKMLPIIGIGLVAIIVLILVLLIRATFKRKAVFKVYSNEPLENHLNDPLNLNRWDKSKSFATDTYFAKELMDYAIKLGTNNIKKRDRYTREGEPTPQLTASINQSKANMIQAFTNNGFVMSDNYCYFIVNYRPYYLVKDFPKTINEYMAFCVNPNAFEKVDHTEKKDEEPQEEPDMKQTASVFVDEAQNSDIDTYEEEEYIEPYDEGMSFEKEPVVTPFRGSVSVGRDITSALSRYAEKLAKKNCDKKKIPTVINGTKTVEFSAACSENYNRLSEIFLSRGYFRSEFVVWANGEYPDHGMEHFEELIAPYLKHIKKG